jgi:phosphoglycerate transport regulatory protein PgtC
MHVSGIVTRIAAGPAWQVSRSWLVLIAIVWVAFGVDNGAYAEPPRESVSFVVVTSFPESLYATMCDEFQSLFPDIHIQVINKKTAAAISFIQKDSEPQPDIFWASSPDAFEILKDTGHLQPYRSTAAAIPAHIHRYPIHDPDGYYTGFAISGYGMMWNREYLKRHNLTPPANWTDLTSAHYFGHVGMSAPSRSGTTHMAVESILQYHGWETGWRILFEIGGNLATITARSFGVPDGVNNRRFGIGIVIDFFGLSSAALGYPVEFTYSRESALLPASVAVTKNARNVPAARKFINFLVSDKGQRLLFSPHIRRLPVVPAVYRDAPPHYPNPFASASRIEFTFNSDLSQQRYNLVNALFDRLITYRRNALHRTWQIIHQAEQRLRSRPTDQARDLIQQARKLATWVPVDGETANDPAFTKIFVRQRRGQPLPARQAEQESEWEATSIRNMKKARAIAQQAMTMMK